LSALPLAPKQSRIFKKFIEKFPRTPRVVGDHVVHWPVMEKIIHVFQVTTFAISPDGRRIVCGSESGMIHMRDIDTGEVLGTPLPGHTGRILSIAISANGEVYLVRTS
jgi:WD40 repeat protein